jgi:hypothetical protein
LTDLLDEYVRRRPPTLPGDLDTAHSSSGRARDCNAPGPDGVLTIDNFCDHCETSFCNDQRSGPRRQSQEAPDRHKEDIT